MSCGSLFPRWGGRCDAGYPARRYPQTVERVVPRGPIGGRRGEAGKTPRLEGATRRVHGHGIILSFRWALMARLRCPETAMRCICTSSLSKDVMSELL